MKNKYILIPVVVLTVFFQSCLSNKSGPQNNSNHIWTFTYLKAQENQKANLKIYLEKNWFAMDRIAVKQGLLSQYELYENKSSESRDWDYIVAVEYRTPEGYDAVAKEFEAIRAGHKVTKVNGLGMKELGSIVKTETVSQKKY